MQPERKNFIKNRIKISSFLGLIGSVLLVVDIIGLFIPLRNPDIYTEKSVAFQNDITLTNIEAKILLNKELPRKEYIIEATNTVNKTIAHYWEDAGIDKYNLRIPFYKNYILYTLSYIYPSIYKKYEFCNYEKAIERGVGLCSQQAIALVNILNRHNIEAKVVGLDGHVVATALADTEKNEWWTLDPDFGVIIKKDIETIEDNPKIIEQYYSEKNSPEMVQKIESIYGKDGNVVYPTGVVNYIDCNWKKIMVRQASYILKWVIPIIFIFPLLWLKLKKIKDDD